MAVIDTFSLGCLHKKAYCFVLEKKVYFTIVIGIIFFFISSVYVILNNGNTSLQVFSNGILFLTACIILANLLFSMEESKKNDVLLSLKENEARRKLLLIKLEALEQEYDIKFFKISNFCDRLLFTSQKGTEHFLLKEKRNFENFMSLIEKKDKDCYFSKHDYDLEVSNYIPRLLQFHKAIHINTVLPSEAKDRTGAWVDSTSKTHSITLFNSGEKAEKYSKILNSLLFAVGMSGDLSTDNSRGFSNPCLIYDAMEWSDDSFHAGGHFARACSIKEDVSDVAHTMHTIHELCVLSSNEQKNFYENLLRSLYLTSNVSLNFKEKMWEYYSLRVKSSKLTNEDKKVLLMERLAS